MPQLPQRRAAAARWTFIVLLLLASPVGAQVYTSDNVVLLANEDPKGGEPNDLAAQYNDLWAFVGTDGREYVVQGTETGTIWWDVEDPLDPFIVKELSGPTSPWRDMFVMGTHAYSTSEGQAAGVQIFDLADPTDPTLVATYTATVGQAHNVFGDPSRNLLFVAGGFSSGANGGIQIFDTTDPVNIVEISQWNARYVHDLNFEGDFLFACLINNTRFRRIDLTNPLSPVSAGTLIDPTGSTHSCWPLGDGIHQLVCEETGGGHLKAVEVIGSTLTIVGAYNPFPTASAHNVHVRGSTAFVSWYTEGLRIVDATDPTALTEIGFFDTLPALGNGFDGLWGVSTGLPSGVIALSDRSHGLFLVQLDPDAAALDGVVLSDVDGALAGATVRYVNHDVALKTDATGAYRHTAFAGASHTLIVSAFGHDPDTLTVSVSAGATTTTNITLTKRPTGTLAGQVTDDATLLPIAEAKLEIVIEGQLLTGVADGLGNYSFGPVPAGSHSFRAQRYGYRPRALPLSVPAGGAAAGNVALTAAFASTDFSSQGVWTVQTDSLDVEFSGTAWEWVVPAASPPQPQPDVDHSVDPEDHCFLTGLADTTASGAANVVHDGRTILTSPIFDLSGLTEPHVGYYRWFWSGGGVDTWLVEATGNGADWVEVERGTPRDPRWVGVDVDLTQHLSTFGAVQVRFVAAETLAASFGVEAGVDDVTFYDAAAIGTGTPGVQVAKPGGLVLAVGPSPFHASTGIEFTVPATARMELAVFDVRGARVVTLVDGVRPAGRHSAVWAGESTRGRTVANGVYFVRLQADGVQQSRKVILLR